jgi:ribosomal protein S18 acetylase RimI-like enzyme
MREESLALIRRYRPEDLEGVMRVEHLAFPDEKPYPAPVFVQYHELFPKTFLVAESRSGVVGYLVAAKSPDVPTWALILSMGVIPKEQGKRIGHALLEKGLGALVDTGVTEVELTVSPENQHALKLYCRMGFKELRPEEDLFGPGTHRIRMTKDVAAGCSAKEST